LAGHFFIVIQSNGAVASLDSLAAADGNFHHIAAVIDRTAQTLSLYVDSVSQGSVAIGTTGSLVNSGNLYLGINTQDFVGSTAVPFNGVVDELSLYDRALTADEITSIFNAGSAGKVKPLDTTAAGVTISGRVKMSNGTGISRASVKLIDRRGNARTTSTNSFGFFHFDDVIVGQTYIVQVTSSRYRIANSTRTITLQDELSGLDFIATGEGKF